MEFDDARTGSRVDVATWLRELAAQVESGGLSLDGAETEQRVPMPDELRYEVEFEAEEGSAKLEIEIEWTNATAEPTESAPPEPTESAPPEPTESAPPEPTETPASS